MSIKIIAGRLKGVSIEVPLSARPTLSRARQCLFDIIESILHDDLDYNLRENITFLDCFAGSGAIGIEFLSRYNSYSYFVEKNKNTIVILKSNIAKVKMENHSTIIHSDIFKLPKCSKKPCDIIFLDPPFCASIDIIKLLNHLAQNLWINENSLIIIETQSEKRSKEIKNSFQQKFMELIPNATILKSKKVGSITFSFFKNYN